MIQGLGLHVRCCQAQLAARRPWLQGPAVHRSRSVFSSSAHSQPLSLDPHLPELSVLQAETAHSTSSAPAHGSSNIIPSSSHTVVEAAVIATAAADIASEAAGTTANVAAAPAEPGIGEASATAAVQLADAATVVQPAAAASVASAETVQAKPTKGGGLANRVIFGCILGFGGAAVVATGKVPYLCAALFVVYQATQVRRRLAGHGISLPDTTALL